MLTRDQAEMVARMTGRKCASPVRVLDHALARAGLSRSERRKLISELAADSTVTPPDHERIAP